MLIELQSVQSRFGNISKVLASPFPSTVAAAARDCDACRRQLAAIKTFCRSSSYVGYDELWRILLAVTTWLRDQARSLTDIHEDYRLRDKNTIDYWYALARHENTGVITCNLEYFNDHKHTNHNKIINIFDCKETKDRDVHNVRQLAWNCIK